MRHAPAILPIGILAALTVATPGHAECRTPVRPSVIKYFVDGPARYVSRFPAGGDPLVQAVRNFATFNRRGLQAIHVAIRIANLPQKRAIGTGMALAVAACLPRDGEIAKQIADVVKTSGDPDVSAAYLVASSGDGSPTAASPTADDRQSGAVRAGGNLNIPTTEAPKLVPELKKVQ